MNIRIVYYKVKNGSHHPILDWCEQHNIEYHVWNMEDTLLDEDYPYIELGLDQPDWDKFFTATSTKMVADENKICELKEIENVPGCDAS